MGDDGLLEVLGLGGGDDLLQNIPDLASGGPDVPADGGQLRAGRVGQISVLRHDGAGDLVLQKAVGGAGHGSRTSMAVFSSASLSPYSLRRPGGGAAPPAMSSSSRVFRLPPMSARWREAATGLTPEKEGLPRSTIMFTAAVVSSRRSGHLRRVGFRAAAGGHRSLPSSVTAWSASRLEHPGQLQGFHGFFKQICHGLAPSLLSRLGRLGGARCRPSPAPPWCQVPR